MKTIYQFTTKEAEAKLKNFIQENEDGEVEVKIINDSEIKTDFFKLENSSAIAVSHKDLDKQIKDLKFNWFNDCINSKNFKSINKDGKKECKIFHFAKYISSENAIKEMKKENFKPADVFDLLAFQKKFSDNRVLIVALGSIWSDSYGDRHVPCLSVRGGKRRLILNYFDYDWDDDYRFLAVRK